MIEIWTRLYNWIIFVFRLFFFTDVIKRTIKIMWAATVTRAACCRWTTTTAAAAEPRRRSTWATTAMKATTSPRRTPLYRRPRRRWAAAPIAATIRPTPATTIITGDVRGSLIRASRNAKPTTTRCNPLPISTSYVTPGNYESFLSFFLVVFFFGKTFPFFQPFFSSLIIGWFSGTFFAPQLNSVRI